MDKIGTLKQLTKEEAIMFFESTIWKSWNYEEIVKFQLFQKLLCIPFDKFHEAIEKVLNRPVYTHEFGLSYEKLIEEYLGIRDKPSLKEILELIPKDKKIIFINR